MPKSLKLILVLTLTAAFSGGLLSYFNMFTGKLIAEHKLKELEKSVFLVIPGAVSFDEVKKNNDVFFIGKDAIGHVKGVAFQAEGNGYQGKIKLLIGTDPKITEIKALKILEQKETPGLGTKIERDPSNKIKPTWFVEQFKGLTTKSPITIVKNQKASGNSEIQAISGATVSSKAVVGILNGALSKKRSLYLGK